MPKRSHRRKSATLFLSAMVLSWLPSIALSQGPQGIPDFNSAKALSGQAHSRPDLNGSPSILIVNPSAEAGDKAKAWAQEIRRHFGPEINQRTIIAVDTPFLITEYMAMSRAKKKVDPQYWNRTWMLRNTDFEEKLGIPSSGGDPHIFVLDSNGGIVTRVQGELNQQKLLELDRGWTKVAGATAPDRRPAGSTSATTESSEGK